MNAAAPLPASLAGARRALPGARAVASGLITVALVAAWLVAARPVSLGGATGYVMVTGSSMEPTLHHGDFVVTRRQDAYRRGDVLAFRIPAGEIGAGAMVIHRVVGGSAADGYVLRGDNRDADDQWRPRPADVMGRMVADVPGAGRWVAMARRPDVLAGLAAMVTILFWPRGRGAAARGTAGRPDRARPKIRR